MGFARQGNRIFVSRKSKNVVENLFSNLVKIIIIVCLTEQQKLYQKKISLLNFVNKMTISEKINVVNISANRRGIALLIKYKLDDINRYCWWVASNLDGIVVSTIECISIYIFYVASSEINMLTCQLNVNELSIGQTLPKIMNQK
jgi:hypothetical protein